MKQHLLLLHGAIGAKDQLQVLSEKLKADYIVHSINFSGHGGESMPKTFSIELFATDVLNYLKQNNIDKINIFGYSMGGYVALFLIKHHPEKINKVFTFATKFLWSPEIAKKEIKMLDPQKIEDKIPTFAQQLAKRHAPYDWKEMLQKTANMMIHIGNHNPLSPPDYESIKHTILVGIGDKDTMVTLEETVEIYHKFENAGLIVFPNTGHPIEKIDFDRLNKEINVFLTPIQTS